MAKKKKKETEVVKDNWSLSIGTYPGLLFGIRSYEEDQISTALGYICHLVLLLSDFFDIYLIKRPL